MKKIFNLLLLCLVVTIYSSCTSEVDDVFDQSSSNRITEALKNDQTILSDAANGWIMQYYPSASLQYGGYNVLVKFNADGTATVASDRYPSTKTATSTYTLSQSAGPVLTFNSYNDVMHYFSDPVNPDDIGIKGKGMEGDLEFRLIEVSKDKVVMRGKKTNARIVMTPMDASISWSDYLSKVSVAEYNMGYGVYKYVAGDITAKVTMNYRTMKITYTENGGEVVKTVPYIVTPNGYQLYDSLSIGNIKVTELTFKGGDNHEFVSDGDGSAKLYGIITPLTELIANGTNWYFSYDNMSAYAKPFWNKAIKDLKDTEQETLRYLYMKSNSIYFQSGTYRGYYNLKVVPDGDKKISLSLSGYDGNGKYYYGKGYFQSFLYPLLGKSGLTFNLSTDNLQNPKVIILTDTSNPDNVIKLTKAAILPPYNI